MAPSWIRHHFCPQLIICVSRKWNKLDKGARPLHPLYPPLPTSIFAAIDPQFVYSLMQPYTIQHKPELLLLNSLLLWFVILAKNKTLFSWFSRVVSSPHHISSYPGARCFLCPNPRPLPPDACRITLHLMALHRKLLSTELRRGWHLIRAQERIKGTMLFFLCELDSGFRLQMRRMAWRTGVHLIPWLYSSKHLQI